jgi:DNA polymerase III sliding clamp (beta) subunit (PCNA family)
VTEIAEVLGESGGMTHDPFAGQEVSPGQSYAGITFSASRFVLLALAEKILPIVPNRDYQPVLRNIAVRVAANGLRFAGTDLELMVIVSTELSECKDIDPAAYQDILLPAKTLAQILKQAPEGDVTIRVSGDEAEVDAGDSRWRIKLSTAIADFPKIPELLVPAATAPRVPFLAAIKGVRHAISKAGTKPNLSQVAIAKGSDGVMQVIASDGQRCACIPLPDFPQAMRIPAASTPTAVDELVRMLSSSEAENFGVGSYGDKLVFFIDSVTLTVDPLTWEFPDMEAQFLKPAMLNNQLLEVSRADLIQAIHRVMITADSATSAIGLRLDNGQVVLYARDSKQNYSQATLSAEWQGGERLLVLNFQALLDMLAVYSQPTCKFLLGKDHGKRKASVLLSSDAFIGITTQMTGHLLGYT